MKESFIHTTLYVIEGEKYETKYLCSGTQITAVFDNMPDVWDYYQEIRERTEGRIHRLLIESEL